jgi:PAS domain S-box-containing protein
MPDDQTRLVRRGLGIFVLIGLGSIASDLLSGRAAALEIGAYRAGGLLGPLLGIGVLARHPDLATARWVLMAVFAFVIAAFLLQTRISQDPFGTQLLLAMVCLTVAVFVPWGWRDQLYFAAIAGVGLVANWLVAGGPLFLMFDTVLACAASVPVAWFLERECAALAASRAEASAGEARLRQIADHAREVFWMLDFADRQLPEVSYLSTAARDLLGLEPGISGRGALLERIHPDDQERLHALFGMAERASRPGVVDFRIVTPAGEPRHVQARFTPIRDDDGRLVRLGGVLEDVTTRHLAVAAMERARDEAQTTARVRSQFLAAMSHEISTPLTAILGTLELLDDAGATAEQRRRWRTVRAAAQSLHLLLSDALDFTKSEAGALVLRSTGLDVGDVVAGIIELHAAPARARGLDLRFEWSGPLLVEARGDADRLRQVLNNLVSNAIKFTPSGEVCVRVAAIDDPPVALRLAVRDTGIGVNAEVRRRIFQPFTQADESIAHRYGGSGLGLAIARRLVTAMGGSIGVDSDRDGSTFWFTLPVGSQAADGPPAAVIGGRRLLVVAADPGACRALQAGLAAGGATSDAAATADAALDALRRADPPYDAVLWVTDGAVPSLARGAAPPSLVVLSTAGRGSDAAAAVESGAALWLAAPIRGAALVERLRACWAPPDGQRTARRWRAPRGRVLVVDDSEMVREVTVDLLRTMGHDASAVSGGAKALAALRRRPVDLVLLDCQMPEMDGFETARSIRAAEADSGTHVAIIAFSAGAPELYRDRCLAAGMDDCLGKPIDAATVDATLARWIDGAAHGPDGAEGIDRARLAELAGHDAVALRRYVDLFVREAREVIQALAAAAAGERQDGLPTIVHRARGAAAYVGAARFEDSLARLDGCATDSVALTPLVAELSLLLDGFEHAARDLERDLSARAQSLP